jgi:hypothetical protein
MSSPARTTADLEPLLGKYPERKGIEFRVERRPDGMWDAGFWRGGEIRVEHVRRYPRSRNGSDGVMQLSAEGVTRDDALANFVDLLNLLDGEDG